MSSLEIRPIQILLVEDNPGDVRLTIEAFKDGRIKTNLDVVGNGVEAMAYLYKEGKHKVSPRPDIIILDLNLPKKDGREVLYEIKTHKVLKRIPVVILTTSQAEEDILNAYDLHANCYITKPINFDKFMTVIKSIEDFWFTVAKLPTA